MKTAVKIGIIAGAVILLGSGAFWLKSYEDKKDLAFKDALESEYRKRDSVESNMVLTLDEIDNRLDSIRDSKGYLIIGPGSNTDGVAPKKDQILNNIAMINSILDENNKQIKEFQTKLAKMDSRNSALKRRLDEYSKRNQVMENQLAELKMLLNTEQEKNVELNSALADKSREIEAQHTNLADLQTKFINVEKEAYTAYYVAGSKKELSKKKVLGKRRGIIPVGPKTVALPISKEEFAQVDTREKVSIETHAKKAFLVTEHQENSYAWQDDGQGMKTLYISDPEAFWQSSKYLVIETK